MAQINAAPFLTSLPVELIRAILVECIDATFEQSEEITQVYVASDEPDPAFWQEISQLGWKWFDHTKERTVAQHNEWYPVLIDVRT